MILAKRLIWLALYCCSQFVQAEDNPCDALPKPAVTIKRLTEKLDLNTTYSYRSLTNIAGAISQPGREVLGLTRGSASAAFSLLMPSLAEASGRWECSSPQITLTYGFTPVTIYVAREFPPGTCAFQEINEHEQRHLKTYQEHMLAIEKSLNDSLSRRFASGSVWRGPVGENAKRLRRELDERWLPYVQREIKRVESAQALIDTPEEYDRVANACDGEIKKRLQH